MSKFVQILNFNVKNCQNLSKFRILMLKFVKISDSNVKICEILDFLSQNFEFFVQICPNFGF